MAGDPSRIETPPGRGGFRRVQYRVPREAPQAPQVRPAPPVPQRTRIRPLIEDNEATLQRVRGKQQSVENKRRTLTLELATVREQMMAAAQEQNPTEINGLSQRHTRLEGVLNILNERKQSFEENEVALMNQKLSLFESNLKELAEEKKLTAGTDRQDALRLRLKQMERKLRNLEERKSMRLTGELVEKMRGVQGEIEQLRAQKTVGASPVDGRIAMLEQQLVQLQNTRITPAMINDEETNTLRMQVKKLEEAMRVAHHKMEEQRARLDQEREANILKQQREQEAYRRQARLREEAVLMKMAEMEQKMRERPVAPPSNSPQALEQLRLRMAEMEARVLESDRKKQQQLEMMEQRVAAANAQLQQELETVELLRSALRGPSGGQTAGDKNAEIASLQAQVNMLVAMDKAKTDKVNSLIEDLNNKVEQLGKGGVAPSASSSGLSYADLNARLAVLREKLFDPDTSERDCETFNIEYEKLITDLEKTPEYQREQEALVVQWKKGNEELNKIALANTRTKLATLSPKDLSAILSKKPELKLLSLAPEQLLRKHENDWKGITTQSLDETEARALYAAMPSFRKDQLPQTQFMEQLKMRIESEAVKPKTKPPPPILATKKVTFKKAPPSGPGGFLEELVRRRKLVEG